VKLHIYTLALDELGFLNRQLAVFRQLKADWHWHIAEGVADSVLDTSWVARMPPRLSKDGTTEWLNTLIGDARISVYRKQLWNGKVEMINTALKTIKEPCVLMQVDADEFWTPDQIEKIVALLERGPYDCAYFLCHYYVGHSIVTVGENCYGNRPGEWLRAWRFEPGMVQAKHEPPVLQGSQKHCMRREDTDALGLRFEHFAYTTRSRVEFKEKYYKYPNAAAQWDRLQANTQWPVRRLADFLPWVGEGVGADILR
jgi:hypothetical protein